jgi:tetratricopeptide (TPR) repeat protein
MSARCRSVLNEREAARDILKSVLAAEPDQPEALLAAALVEIDLENFPEALRCLRRLEPQAGSPPVEEAFQKLLRLEPAPDSRSIPTRLQTIYHLLATVLRRTGPDAEADAYERKLLEHDTAVADLLVVAKEQARLPNDPEVWYKMGVLNLKVGMKDTGEYWLKRVLRAHPNDRRAHRALADFYRGRPDPESQFKADQHARLAGGAQ